MSEDLKLDIKGLQSEIKKLDDAIKVFEPYSKKFIKNTQESFQGFNSDFICKMDTLLGNMRDTEAPGLVKELKSFSKMITKAVDAFEEQDQEYAKKLRGSQNGK